MRILHKTQRLLGACCIALIGSVIHTAVGAELSDYTTALPTEGMEEILVEDQFAGWDAGSGWQISTNGFRRISTYVASVSTPNPSFLTSSQTVTFTGGKRYVFSLEIMTVPAVPSDFETFYLSLNADNTPSNDELAIKIIEMPKVVTPSKEVYSKVWVEYLPEETATYYMTISVDRHKDGNFLYVQNMHLYESSDAEEGGSTNEGGEEVGEIVDAYLYAPEDFVEWTVNPTSGLGGWQNTKSNNGVDAYVKNDGVKSAFLHTYKNQTPYTAWMISPIQQLQVGVKYDISYEYCKYVGAYTTDKETLKFYVSKVNTTADIPTEGVLVEDLSLIEISSSEDNNVWLPISGTFTPEETAEYYFAFAGECNSGANGIFVSSFIAKSTEIEEVEEPGNEPEQPEEIVVEVGKTIPYSNALTSSTLNLGEEWIVIDANNDGVTWSAYATEIVSGYTSRGKGEMNDWVVSPALSLEEGKSYVFTYQSRSNDGWGDAKETFKSYVAKGNTPEEFLATPVLDQAVNYNATAFEERKFQFTCEETGNYWFAMHCTSPEYQYGVCVKNFSVEEGTYAVDPNIANEVKVVPYDINPQESWGSNHWSTLKLDDSREDWAQYASIGAMFLSPYTSGDRDAYLISPAVTLEADKNYKLKIEASTNDLSDASERPEHIRVVYATSKDEAALKAATLLYENKEYTDDSNKKNTTERTPLPVPVFSPEEDGNYYFAYHVATKQSPKSTTNYVYRFAIEETDEEVPETPIEEEEPAGPTEPEGEQTVSLRLNDATDVWHLAQIQNLPWDEADGYLTIVNLTSDQLIQTDVATLHDGPSNQNHVCKFSISGFNFEFANKSGVSNPRYSNAWNNNNYTEYQDESETTTYLFFQSAMNGTRLTLKAPEGRNIIKIETKIVQYATAFNDKVTTLPEDLFIVTGAEGTISTTYASRPNSYDWTALDSGANAITMQYNKGMNMSVPEFVVTTVAEGQGDVVGVDELQTAEGAEVEYYTLQGVKVKNPERGIYIKRAGGKTQKVLVK